MSGAVNLPALSAAPALILPIQQGRGELTVIGQITANSVVIRVMKLNLLIIADSEIINALGRKILAI